MDAQFMEFWAELLKSAASGQRRLDEVSKWMDQGLSGFKDLTDLFRRAYGLGEAPEKSPDFALQWNRAAEAFQESMKEYLSLFGVVSMKEYLDLAAKYEDLKKKDAAREETVRHLRLLLEGKESQEKLQSGLQKLVALQSEQFKELMRRLGFLPGDPER